MRSERLIDILTADHDDYSRWTFPKLLKAERLHLRWTQEQAAEAIGVSRTTYRQLEEGRNDPRLSTLMRLVRAGYRIEAIVPELVRER
jgi:transcriptional regulator with XRE-family HTH domain